MAASAAPGNLLDLAGLDPGAEQLLTLVDAPGACIERIVSHGQQSAPGFWYDQDFDEWVLILAGAARLRFDDGAPDALLRPGDHLLIAARRRHRVEWTDAPTIWLAVHLRPAPGAR